MKSQRLSIDEALQRVGDDPRLLLDLIRSTCRIQREAPEKLRTLYENAEYDELKRLVHTLASGMKMVGAVRSSELAYQTEEQMLQGQRELKLDDLIHEVSEDLQELQKVLASTEKLQSSAPTSKQGTSRTAAEVLDIMLDNYGRSQRIKSSELDTYLNVLESQFLPEEILALREDIERYQFAKACTRLEELKQKK